jgi:hypothetical protein
MQCELCLLFVSQQQLRPRRDAEVHLRQDKALQAAALYHLECDFE